MKKKVSFRIFTSIQWKQEQEFLRRQHRNGWRFVKLDFLGFYLFEKCDPEDVVYQLDFNPDGIAHKDEYVQMFRDCGWEYMQDYVGYSYFRKPVSEMNGSEEIFCDDSSRLDFIKRVFRERIVLLPIISVFNCFIMPKILLGPLFGNLAARILTGIFLAFGILYFALFMLYSIQLWEFRKSLKQ